MCLGATTQDASLGHLDHPPNGRLKANYFNVLSTVVARTWYSEASAGHGRSSQLHRKIRERYTEVLPVRTLPT
jgi:hypothetical protein